MQTDPKNPKSVDEYIADFPADVRERLLAIRMAIREAAPEAEEVIKYNIPTFTLKGNLVSFAAYKKHIGIYPVPAGTAKFQKEISGYRAAKSTLQFSLDRPIPLDLVDQLVRFRVKENLERAMAKGKG